MKNLLVFVHPSKVFGEHFERLIKMQIDNSLQMGWCKEDIILATNFPYEYNGVKSLVVDDSCFCAHRIRASKVTTILYLLENNLIDDLCWYHDPDAFQLQPLEPDLDGVDVGFTKLSEPNGWNTGSFFFKPTAKDIFMWIRNLMYQFTCHDEQALYVLVSKNSNGIRRRFRALNPTYNYCRLRRTEDVYKLADKPIRVAHFNPNLRNSYDEVRDLLPDGLVEILRRHRMVNLMIYIGPTKGFSIEHEELTKMQIDNSIDNKLGLGWRAENMLLVTDFPFRYRGINSYVVRGDFRALDGNRSSKILVINQLFKDGTIWDATYWFHDHDAFQLETMRDPELGSAVAGFTDQGWSKTWNAGSFFFTKDAKDIFQKIYDTMIERGVNEQDALTYLWENGLTGYKMLNMTYNLGIYHIPEVLPTVEKPLLVVHFHPHKPKHLDLFRPYIPSRLERIFNGYNIK